MSKDYSQAISTLPDRTEILVGRASSSRRPIILKVSDFGSRWRENQPQPDYAPPPVAENPEPGAEA